ncbi:hypothetical protein DDB_G0270516 [Dictyostelium discoideum AX4]|uniref:EF-hand domain-containing protein n=1 Tax=Dictyostelium discoideum TaxID=44689 RepID=Q55E20_DICDI|nr:hypothetical protein DDB_G0270516 [Dictyostelium discoideum AX4]EAL72608.1 hypothetical protein DDB_G0270516 [Dictyostelium discoideum AX4]|eukprot:XP_645961.1 hypothetical protein DDB_G0270516 [Dictyostelium discoideum AX4]
MEDINFLKNYDKNDLKHAIKSLTGVEVSDDFISILQKQIASNGDTEIDFDEFREAFSQITKSLYPNGILGNSDNHSNNGVIDGNCSMLHQNGNNGCESKTQSNPPTPQPTPQRSRSNSCSSSVSQLSDLPSPPNSPRNSDSENSFSPYSFSPLSSSPPKFIYALSTSPGGSGSGSNSGSPPKPTYYSTTANIFNKPPPPLTSSPRRPRSSSVRQSQPIGITKEPLNDDQHIMLMNHNSGSNHHHHHHHHHNNNNNNNNLVGNSTFNSPSDKSKYKPQPTQINSHSRNNSHHNSQNSLHTNQLFKSLLNMDENYSDTKKSRSKHSHQRRSPIASIENSDNEDNGNNNNNNQFHMDIDWSKQLENKNKKKFTYKIQDGLDNESNSSSESEDIYNTLNFNFNNNNNKKHSSKKSNKKSSSNNKNNNNKFKDEIEWATEEFYYDPTLDNSEDLHQVISILKEKYSLYSNKSSELEKKVQTALKTNNQLEDDLDVIKKDCITLSLSNQALKKNNQILESSLEYHNTTNAQIKQSCFNLEKENQILKKRLQLFEDQMEKNQLLLENQRLEQELRDSKFNSEIELLSTQYSKTIQSIKSEYQKEFELEYKKNKDLLTKNELKSMEIQLENQQLRQLLLESNKNLEHLEKLYDEKIKEYQSHQEESQSQTISQEILSTENQKLKKQLKKSELQKILELKNEIKRTKKEHLHYKSLLLQDICIMSYLVFCFFFEDSPDSSFGVVGAVAVVEFVDSFDSFDSFDVVVVVVEDVDTAKAAALVAAAASSISCGGIFSAKYSGFLMLIPYSLNANERSSVVNTNALSFLVFSLDVPCNLILQNCKLSLVTSDINFCVANDINLFIL